MDRQSKKHKIERSAKECAYLATFVALLIAVQLVLSSVAGIELVTVLMVAYVFVMGVWRGLVIATCFSLLRTLMFGFFPNIVLLYWTYYSLVAIIFGLLGKGLKTSNTVTVAVVTACACVSTVLFTLLDDVITPLYYAYSLDATKAYFFASIPVMIPHVICVGISVAVLFYPLYKTFAYLYKRL